MLSTHNGLGPVIKPDNDDAFVFNPVAAALAVYCLFGNPTGRLEMRGADEIMIILHHILIIVRQRAVYLAMKAWWALSTEAKSNPMARTRYLWDEDRMADETQTETPAGGAIDHPDEVDILNLCGSDDDEGLSHGASTTGGTTTTGGDTMMIGRADSGIATDEMIDETTGGVDGGGGGLGCGDTTTTSTSRTMVSSNSQQNDNSHQHQAQQDATNNNKNTTLEDEV